MLVTYIIRTSNNEFYCNKTETLPKTIGMHRLETYPNWFYKEERRHFKDIIFFKGDFVSRIKKFGIKRFYKAVMQYQRYLII